MRKLMLVLALPLASGCAAALVGGALYAGAQSKNAKQEFTTWFQRTNAERQMNGLAPLDWCSEQYKFDRGWAMDDPNCKKRILAYEKGDQSALDISDAHFRAVADSLPVDTTRHANKPASPFGTG